MNGGSEIVIPLFGFLDITGEVITEWCIIAVLAIVSLIATHNLRERPGRFQNVIETGVEYLDNFFSGILGRKNARKYFFFLQFTFIYFFR